MKAIFKDTKFWMYIPFACIYGLKMSKWVFEPDNETDRGWRMVFQLLSVVYSLILGAIVSGIIYRIWVV
jgi:hypothetical protein